MKDSVWKAGYIGLNEERHTLSISNPFFLGFDTDIAFEAQVGPGRTS